MTLNSLAKERHGNEKKLLVLDQSKPVIPAWLIWIQCIAFVVLYAVWILPEIVGFRNTALVVGALAGLYPIYQYRAALWTKRAIPIWLIVALFAWATFHLLFLSHDYAAQLLEYKRIWKYAAIGAVFAFGLGLSIAGNSKVSHGGQLQSAPFWWVIFLGLCVPAIIYLVKYFITTYAAKWGIPTPPHLRIHFIPQPYYVPKSDYVAFCLPTFAIALAQIEMLLSSRVKILLRHYLAISIYIALISVTLFLFFIQNTKNGFAHAFICAILLFIGWFFKNSSKNIGQKGVLVIIGCLFLYGAIYLQIQKNDSWRTLVADTKIAFQLEKYQQWKYANERGYPDNEYGKMVSVTNYERAAWFMASLKLACKSPLGYGMVEDSFRRVVKAEWSDASPRLSHSHSGWMDIILGLGFPGFFCVLTALLLNIGQSSVVREPWKSLVVWALIANLILWVTTEVAATVTFCLLVFWIALCCGLTLVDQNQARVISRS